MGMILKMERSVVISVSVYQYVLSIS